MTDRSYFNHKYLLKNIEWEELNFYLFDSHYPFSYTLSKIDVCHISCHIYTIDVTETGCVQCSGSYNMRYIRSLYSVYDIVYISGIDFCILCMFGGKDIQMYITYGIHNVLLDISTSVRMVTLI